MKRSDQTSKPDAGLGRDVKEIMSRLLQMPPEQQKAAPKPRGGRAEAQRRRRRKERKTSAMASHGGA
jgi:hypothetical protein